MAQSAGVRSTWPEQRAHGSPSQLISFWPYCSTAMAMPELEDTRKLLFQKVRSWSRQLKVEPRRIRIQRMTRKWGSCSSAGTITLAADLVEQDAGFQDFVIAHELLHLRVPNHSKLFKALISAHLPGWREHNIRRLRNPGRA